MKALKIIGLVLLALVVLALVGSLLLPADIHVERSKVINQPKEKLYSIVVDLKQMGEWDPWSNIDPNMETTYEGEDATVGSKRSWTSENDSVGDGTMTITEIRENEYVSHALDFGDKGKADSYIALEEADGGTKVTWGFDMNVGMNPVGKYFGMMMDKFIGPDYEKGLNNLADYAATVLDASAAAVLNLEKYSVESLPEFHLLGIKYVNAPFSDLEKLFADSYGKLYAFAKENNITSEGSPGAIYYEWDEEASSTDFAVVIPVGKEVKGAGEVEYIVAPATTAVAYDHVGGYGHLASVYEQLMAKIETDGYQVAGPAMEVYDVGPPAETDSNKFVTVIMFPVAEK